MKDEYEESIGKMLQLVLWNWWTWN